MAVALFLLSFHAYGNESLCGSLFSQIPYPKPQPFEAILIKKAQNYFAENSVQEIPSNKTKYTAFPLTTNQPKQQLSANKTLNAYLHLLNIVSYYRSKEKILSSSQKEEIQKRYKEASFGLTLTASEILTSKGIQHTLIYSYGKWFIKISPEGSNYINQLQRRYSVKYNLKFYIANDYLLNIKAGAAFSKVDNAVFIPTYVITEDSIIQQEPIFHELTHHKDTLSEPRDFLNALIHVANGTALAYNYRNSFHITELSAYRATLRAIANEALFAKDKVHLDHNYTYFIERMQMVLSMAKITKEAIQYQMNALLNPPAKEKPKFKIVFEGNLQTEHLLYLYNVASNAETAYASLLEKMSQFEKQNTNTKRSMLKKAIQILTLPEIKNSTGELISKDKITEILDPDSL